MTTQISVRLPDALVAFLDERVAGGGGASRADIVARALERERRRVLSIRDIEILAASGDDPDLAAFTDWASTNIPPLD